MDIVIVGAGASIEEGKRIGLSEEDLLPTMSEFASKMWINNAHAYRPNHLMHPYLKERGVDPGRDATETFVRAVESGKHEISIERFFDWAWRNQHRFEKDSWRDLIYHGIGNALVFQLIKFHVNGVGWQKLEAAQLVANSLSPNDLVVNLNYDTLFEMGAEQAGVKFTYVTDVLAEGAIRIAKPHGSLNLVVKNNGFAFGQPTFIHMVLQPGEKTENLRGIVPPRFSKEYA